MRQHPELKQKAIPGGTRRKLSSTEFWWKSDYDEALKKLLHDVPESHSHGHGSSAVKWSKATWSSTPNATGDGSKIQSSSVKPSYRPKPGKQEPNVEGIAGVPGMVAGVSPPLQGAWGATNGADFFELRASDALKNKYNQSYIDTSLNKEIEARRKRVEHDKRAGPKHNDMKRLAFSTVGRDYALTPFDQKLKDGPADFATRRMKNYLPRIYPPLPIEDQVFLNANANNPDAIAKSL